MRHIGSPLSLGGLLRRHSSDRDVGCRLLLSTMEGNVRTPLTACAAGPSATPNATSELSKIKQMLRQILHG